MSAAVMSSSIHDELNLSMHINSHSEHCRTAMRPRLKKSFVTHSVRHLNMNDRVMKRSSLDNNSSHHSRGKPRKPCVATRSQPALLSEDMLNSDSDSSDDEEPNSDDEFASYTIEEDKKLPPRMAFAAMKMESSSVEESGGSDHAAKK